MKRIPVQSSNVVSIGYDAATQILEVEYQGNKVYHYTDVPPEVHLNLMDAPSKGRYLATVVKPGYAATRLGAPVDSPGESGG